MCSNPKSMAPKRLRRRLSDYDDDGGLKSQIFASFITLEIHRRSSATSPSTSTASSSQQLVNVVSGNSPSPLASNTSLMLQTIRVSGLILAYFSPRIFEIQNHLLHPRSRGSTTTAVLISSRRNLND